MFILLLLFIVFIVFYRISYKIILRNSIRDFIYYVIISANSKISKTYKIKANICKYSQRRW